MYDVNNGVTEPFPSVYDEAAPVKRFATPTKLFTFDPNFTTGTCTNQRQSPAAGGWQT